MIINDLYNKKQGLSESQLDAGEDPYYFRVRHQTPKDIELEMSPKAWDAVGPAYATYEEAQAALKALQAKYPNKRFTYTQHPRISNMGGTPHRAFPPGVAEGLDPEKKQRLKDLIDQYRDATDPDASYELDAEEVIAQIRQEFGDRTADSVEQGPSMHYPKPGHSRGYDPMQYKSSPRITKSGVLNKQDVGSMKRDIKQRLKQDMAEDNAGVPVHRIGLTVTDPNHPMVSKRGETIQKTVRVPGADREKAINSAIAHYRRKGYKVHDHHYIGTVDQDMMEGPVTKKPQPYNDPDWIKKLPKDQLDALGGKRYNKDKKDKPVKESIADDMAAMAKKKFPNAYISKNGQEVQKPENWDKPYTPPAAAPVDLEKQQRELTAKYPNIDELVRRAELNRDPDYEMADGQAYYAARDAEQNYQKLRQIQRVIQGLNESLDRSHLP